MFRSEALSSTLVATIRNGGRAVLARVAHHRLGRPAWILREVTADRAARHARAHAAANGWAPGEWAAASAGGRGAAAVLGRSGSTAGRGAAAVLGRSGSAAGRGAGAAARGGGAALGSSTAVGRAASRRSTARRATRAAGGRATIRNDRMAALVQIALHRQQRAPREVRVRPAHVATTKTDALGVWSAESSTEASGVSAAARSARHLRRPAS